MHSHTTSSKDVKFRSLVFRIIGRSLPICSEAALQTQVQKKLPKGSIIFKDLYRSYTGASSHSHRDHAQEFQLCMSNQAGSSYMVHA